MIITRAYKTELDPNNTQRTLLLQHAGAARWAYNWGLQARIDFYRERQKSIGAEALHKHLNQLKNIPVEDGGVPWMYEVSKCAPQEALRDLDAAFENFFRQTKDHAVKRNGFPTFKTRKRHGIGGFRLTGLIQLTSSTIRLPRLGTLRLKERDYLPVGVKPLSATLSERSGRWFVSILVKEDVCAASTRKIMRRPASSIPSQPPVKVLGVDVGISRMAVTSDGQIFDNPRALRQAETSLRRKNKSLHRTQPGSKNREKAKQALRIAHYRVSCIRSDAIAKATSTIAKLASVIATEDLNVAGMLHNRNLSKSVADASMGRILQQLTYKVAWLGGTLFRADRWFPSSKTCSNCGLVLADLPLSAREWSCPSCGVTHDRDVNAARNLRNLAASSAVTACGESGSGSGDPVSRSKLDSTKQEPCSVAVDNGQIMENGRAPGTPMQTPSNARSGLDVRPKLPMRRI